MARGITATSLRSFRPTGFLLALAIFSREVPPSLLPPTPLLPVVDKELKYYHS